MTDTVYNKVINYIDRHHMIEAGDLVAVGVSGGADSVCLLHLLRRLSEKMPYRLFVVHVDHGVRAESASDAAYVERLCGEMGIPFCLHRADMKGYAAAHRLSLEEAGRRIRYRAFEEELARQRRGMEPCRIAVAHNANDRAETMLFHLFRGSGMRGLSSIQPVRGAVIRPLLCLEREQIEEYLASQGLKYCQDSTNESDDYTRNKIRHHILPYAAKEICSQTVAHMGELADLLSDTERYLDELTQELYGKFVEEAPAQESLRIRGRQLLGLAPVMYKRVLLMCMEKLTPHRKDITSRHIAELVRLIGSQGSKELSLPYGIKAYKEYDWLILSKKTRADVGGGEDSAQADGSVRTYPVSAPMEISLPDGGSYTFTILENHAGFWENQQNIQENRYTKWFDYDKITTALVLRTRRQGDYLTIDAALHTKSVKQYMINEKIPKILRDGMYLLVDGAHVLWIPGYRTSQYYKADQSTKRILQVQLGGGRYGGTNRSVID